jgi:hypothetical protein
MHDGERRTPIDIEVCRSKVKVTTSKKNLGNFVTISVLVSMHKIRKGKKNYSIKRNQ